MSTRTEKRNANRQPQLNNYRVEIKLVGEPIYQFKVADISQHGAGLVVPETSAFLNLIHVEQVLDVTFISPQGSEPDGVYKVKIRHITELDHSRYKAVRLVGVRILQRKTTG